MMRIFDLAAIAFPLTCVGCAAPLQEIGQAPKMSAVGSGIGEHSPTHLGSSRPMNVSYASANSLWQDAGADLFRDPRASKIGDVVTVKISIKDRASLDNSTNRKRESSRDLDLKLGYGLNTSNINKHLQAKGDGNLNPSMSSNTSSKGEGAVSRSENIDLLVGAIVTDVLPNGNIVISGKQEVVVNFELRELSVTGVIRPRDIATDNSISYEKIAEARIAYGGRGRVMEVQQPGWGHQLIDVFSPF